MRRSLPFLTHFRDSCGTDLLSRALVSQQRRIQYGEVYGECLCLERREEVVLETGFALQTRLTLSSQAFMQWHFRCALVPQLERMVFINSVITQKVGTQRVLRTDSTRPGCQMEAVRAQLPAGPFLCGGGEGQETSLFLSCFTSFSSFPFSFWFESK